MIRREDWHNKEKILTRKNLGLSGKHVTEVLGARYIISRLQTDQPSVILDYLIESERRERTSVERVKSALESLRCVQSVQETAKGSREDLNGKDLIVNLRDRKISKVYIQVKTSSIHLMRFLEEMAEKHDTDVRKLTTHTLRKHKLIPIVALFEDQIIQAFLGNLRAIEDFHISHGTADRVLRVTR